MDWVWLCFWPVTRETMDSVSDIKETKMNTKGWTSTREVTLLLLFCCCWLTFKSTDFFFLLSPAWRRKCHKVVLPSDHVCVDTPFADLIPYFWYPCRVFSVPQLMTKTREWGLLGEKFYTQHSRSPHFCLRSFGQIFIIWLASKNSCIPVPGNDWGHLVSLTHHLLIHN